MATQIIIRNDKSNQWQASNPILESGEIGLELDTKKFKVGDGKSKWSLLDYYNIADLSQEQQEILDDLSSNESSILHYHDSDRDRSNHTGTQEASTISDFDTEVSNNSDVVLNNTHRTSNGSDHTFIDQDVTSTSIPSFNAVDLNLDVTVNNQEGRLRWNIIDGVPETGLPDGVVGQHFLEGFIIGQNDTGDILPNGMVATYYGSIGNSGNIRIHGNVASSIEYPLMTLGILTSTIANGAKGKITTRGKVRGIQTNGANYGEVWSDGDVVYKSPTIAGGLTKVPPNAPIPAIPIAVVISAHSTNGTLLVRPTFPTSLEMLTDVNGTVLDTTGQFPVWDNTNKYFDFTSNINDFVDLVSNQTIGGEKTFNDDTTILSDAYISGIIYNDGVYGGLHVHDNTISDSIPTGTTYTKITHFTDNGYSKNVTADATNNKLTITIPGVYRVEGSFSISTSIANTIIWGTVFLGGVEQDQIHFKRYMGAGDIGNSAFSGFITVTTTPVDLDMRVRHDRPGLVDIILDYGNINIQRVGNI